MNRSDYKRLGDYIEPVDERNTNGEIKLSQGISNNKYFQTPKQVATDSTKDNIVRRGYFAYNRATTRNGEKFLLLTGKGKIVRFPAHTRFFGLRMNLCCIRFIYGCGFVALNLIDMPDSNRTAAHMSFLNSTKCVRLCFRFRR